MSLCSLFLGGRPASCAGVERCLYRQLLGGMEQVANGGLKQKPIFVSQTKDLLSLSLTKLHLDKRKDKINPFSLPVS